MPSLRQSILPGILTILCTAFPFIAEAQDSTAGMAPGEGQTFLRITNTRHPLATPENAVGRVEGGRSLRRMVLVLSPSMAQEEELKKLLDQQQNPHSPNYHHWLTAEEFGARFGIADADVAAVRAWLEGEGFVVGPVAASKRWIEFSGTAAQVESAFHTEMRYYRVAGETYLANATDLALPSALSGAVQGVLSLNNFVRKPSSLAAGTTNTYKLTPPDLTTIYHTKGLLSSGVNGSGIAIAIAAQSQIELSDARQFRQILALTPNDPTILLNGPDPGIASQVDASEALRNVAWAGAVAPGATIDLVVAGSTDTTSGMDLAAAYAIDNEIAPILAYTYGSCERALGAAENAFYSALWQQAAAEGITALVAAKNDGAAGCDNPVSGDLATLGSAVNGVASTPYNVAVSGTEFAEGALPSGRASTIYPKPGWQLGNGAPADGARDVPDVSLPRESSAATSAMAGILALVEQENGAYQGQVNYTLYRLAGMAGNSCDSAQQTNPPSQSSCVFYNVTAGSYNPGTGLGSIDATNLAAAWKTAALAGPPSKVSPQDAATFALSVSPATIPLPAGQAGSGTVTITPSGGFTGTVTLTCATGGTNVPAGYSCSFAQASVPVTSSAATTAINLTPVSTATSGVKVASASRTGAIWGMGFAGGLALFGFVGLGSGRRRGRNFVVTCGLVAGVVCAAIGCGGGGAGGGGGQVATTTTLASSDLHVGFGTPVTLTVRVAPNGNATPEGFVQLFDNGQAYGAPVKVSAGIASFLTTNLPIGVHTMTAQYQGDANTAASTSPAITEVIAGTVTLQITGTSNGVTQTASFQAAVN